MANTFTSKCIKLIESNGLTQIYNASTETIIIGLTLITNSVNDSGVIDMFIRDASNADYHILKSTKIPTAFLSPGANAIVGGNSGKIVLMAGESLYAQSLKANADIYLSISTLEIS